MLPRRKSQPARVDEAIKVSRDRRNTEHQIHNTTEAKIQPHTTWQESAAEEEPYDTELDTEAEDQGKKVET